MSRRATEIGVGRGYVGHTFLISVNYSAATAPDVPCKFVIKLPNSTIDWVAVFPGEPWLIEWCDTVASNRHSERIR